MKTKMRYDVQKLVDHGIREKFTTQINEKINSQHSVDVNEDIENYGAT